MNGPLHQTDTGSERFAMLLLKAVVTWLCSRETGKSRSSTRMDGFGVYQDFAITGRISEPDSMQSALCSASHLPAGHMLQSSVALYCFVL